MKLILDLAAHLSVTLGLCIVMPEYASAWILGGILIDLDHLFDYFLWDQQFRLDDFLSARFLESGKLYLPLHSLELVFVLIVIGILLPSDWCLAVSSAMGFHLLIDFTHTDNMCWWFLTYRAAKKWDASAVLK
jgi:hypothetical protein